VGGDSGVHSQAKFLVQNGYFGSRVTLI